MSIKGFKLIDGTTEKYDYDALDNKPDLSGGVEDVQINGTSIIEDGVANVPIAATGTYGVIKNSANRGIGITQSGELYTISAGNNDIKSAASSYVSIVPSNQHRSTFYGLAKAAGSDEKNSTLPVGTYTDEAKAAIKNMLGISEVVVETIEGSDPVIVAQDNHRYICGEVTSLDFTPCESGICDVVFTCGGTKTLLTLPETVKMPEGFDVELNTTYEINIMDGYLGVVGAWT